MQMVGFEEALFIYLETLKLTKDNFEALILGTLIKSQFTIETTSQCELYEVQLKYFI